MENELLNIKERLAKIALEREQERMQAHQTAMKELADARTAEEERQNAAKERINQRIQEKQRLAQVEKAAIEARQQEEATERRLVEQEENRRQAAINEAIEMKEVIRKRLDELEHAEERAKKELRDAALMLDPPDTESVKHPLQRFLQHTPE